MIMELWSAAFATKAADPIRPASSSASSNSDSLPARPACSRSACSSGIAATSIL